MVIINLKEKKDEKESQKKVMRLGKYELGRTLGEGNFGKVKFAKNIESGQSFAVKILEKSRIIDCNVTDQVCFSIQSWISMFFSVFGIFNFFFQRVCFGLSHLRVFLSRNFCKFEFFFQVRIFMNYKHNGFLVSELLSLNLKVSSNICKFEIFQALGFFLMNSEQS